uniref:Uncharacterized protein n=1 Tax=Anguilla anguilla TaxID=7936 RepID=A0A0E9RFI1_ANGAN
MVLWFVFIRETSLFLTESSVVGVKRVKGPGLNHFARQRN